VKRIIDVDPSTLRVSAFYEKPKEGSGVTSSRAASVVFYVFRAASLILLPQYLQAHHALDELVFGRFIQWLLTRGGVKRRVNRANPVAADELRPAVRAEAGWKHPT